MKDFSTAQRSTMKKTITIRQGDVALIQVAALPQDCKPVPLENGRIVLAYGEVTGHAHAIVDHGQDEKRATEIAEDAIARARLWVAPNGERYLEVVAPVTLRHEEHTEHTVPPGIYKQPTQVEYVAPELIRQVED
jgi:hypothetical protein